MKIKSLLQGKKRYAAAVMAAAVLGGGAYAFAASLTVTTNSLGSGTAGVTNTCNLSTAYTTDYSSNHYYLATVAVTPTGGGTACDSLYYRVTVANSSGTSLEEWTGQLSGTGTATLTATLNTVDAAAIANITAVAESNSQP